MTPRPPFIAVRDSVRHVRVVVLFPFFGTVMVLALLFAIWLEARAGYQGKSNVAAPSGPS